MTTIGVGVGVGVRVGVVVEVGIGVGIAVGVLVTIGGGAATPVEGRGVAAGVSAATKAPLRPSIKAIIVTATTRMMKTIARMISNFI
jgi:hypothetical protein